MRVKSEMMRCLPTCEGGFRATIAIVCLALFLVGCDDGQRPRRVVVPTWGRLFYKGKPAVGAMVFLHPVDAEGKQADWWAGYPRAMVGPEGDFRFTTYITHDGAPTGRYVLIATWNRWALASPDDADEAELKPELGEDFFVGRFADPATSRISCVIEGVRSDLGQIELQP